MNFREFYKLAEQDSWAPLGMVIGGGNAFGAMPTQWTGSQQGDDPLSSGGFMGTNWVNGKFDLMLPNVTKRSIIKFINKKKNPILIFLDDGTKLYLPYDAYKKIKVQPEVGRTLMVTFMRRGDDASIVPANIKTIQCF